MVEPQAIEKFQDILVQGHVLEPGKRVKYRDLVARSSPPRQSNKAATSPPPIEFRA